MSKRTVNLEKISKDENKGLVLRCQRILDLEDIRADKELTKIKYQEEADKIIADYKETIRDIDNEISRLWLDVKTGQLSLDLNVDGFKILDMEVEAVR